MTIQCIAPYRMADHDAVIDSIYQDLNTQTFRQIADRIARVSYCFLNKPYVAGCLGEGPDGQFDQNPLYRTDQFDCVTFINTVLALVLSKNRNEFHHNLLRINYYDAELKYEKRFHFMSADWNVQNVRQGLVTDVTIDIHDTHGQLIYEMAVAQIDRPRWFLHRGLNDIKLKSGISTEAAANLLDALHAQASTVCSEKIELPYVALTRLFKDGEPDQSLFAQIPHGSIIEIVRPNWDLRDQIGTCLNVSHIGFGLWIDGELIFRQASH